MEHHMTETSTAPLSDDILQGAAEIAAFLFGDRKQRRRIYWLAENGRLPVFKLGELLCARKSRLRQHVEEQEEASLKA
jgi:hypothetical protein